MVYTFLLDWQLPLIFVWFTSKSREHVTFYILIEHTIKKFEINRTKIKGACQSRRKVATHNSRSDLPLVCWVFFHFFFSFKVRYVHRNNSSSPTLHHLWVVYKQRLFAKTKFVCSDSHKKLVGGHLPYFSHPPRRSKYVRAGRDALVGGISWWLEARRNAARGGGVVHYGVASYDVKWHDAQWAKNHKNLQKLRIYIYQHEKTAHWSKTPKLFKNIELSFWIFLDFLAQCAASAT